ncbi:unnamed protein product [Rotaria socialis]|uniref:Uncharacterized protein n=1 Tax=Rotaria socialis TaxID=392032 RepID=A0A821D4L0_9BILA|nr:unnamed protein product [Rotaria socialis]
MRQLKYKLTDGNPTGQGNSSINSAENNLSAIVSSLLELPGPLDHLQTENHSNEIIITSNVESFDRQVEQPIQSTVHTTSLILPVINQFDQCLLIAKKKFFQNQVLVESPDGIETPDILGAIRVGSVFHLKESVGCHIIEALENECVDKFFRKFRNHEKLIILGPTIRPECSYNASYVSGLLNLNDQKPEIIMKFLAASENDQLDAITKNELIRSGFTRLNLSYFTSDEGVDYVLNAIEFIANDGWQFLPLVNKN